jgi:AcrR family transcriptional regulator
MARAALKRASRGGRPSREAALRLRENILLAATALFLEQGYGSTSIEAVAQRAGISKRTFYDRFDDKAQLFAAVVHRIIAEIRPPPEVPLLAGATLADVLRRLAALMLRAALAPQALALHRLVHAESSRFPELVRAVASDGSAREGVELISALLARELPANSLGEEEREFAAQQFIYMVVTLPQRRALGFGSPMSAAELERYADRVVRLFLDGCRGWARR